jgi:hypothetical protein
MEKSRQIPIISSDELLKMAEKIVSRYIFKGAIPMRDKEDVVMGMVEKFLSSQEKISKSFKGDSKISTYCIAILNRMCCEIIRREFKRWKEVNNEEAFQIELNGTKEYETSKKVVIQSEIDRFWRIMELFYQEKAKILLCVKFILGIEIQKIDVRNYTNHKENFYFDQFKALIDASLADKYAFLASLVNKVENTNVKGDAIRMWLNKKTDSIIYRLNGNGSSKYDKQSLTILLEIIDT